MNEPPVILLVDDDRTILAMYGDFLESKGFAVIRANDGEKALERLTDAPGSVDLVVTDIMMARMDGWQLLTYIRKELGLNEIDLPVIVMSAVEGVDLQVEYIRHKANDWITKPVRPMARLVAKARALLGLDAGNSEKGNSDEPNGSPN